MEFFNFQNTHDMKKEALELVRKIYQSLKWDIPHGNLEDIFNGAKTQAKFFCEKLIEENKDKQEKYEMLLAEIEKVKFQMV
jgi:hypothetical protein